MSRVDDLETKNESVDQREKEKNCLFRKARNPYPLS